MNDPLAIPQWCVQAAQEIIANLNPRTDPQLSLTETAECIENHFSRYLESLPDEATALAEATAKVERLAAVLKRMVNSHELGSILRGWAGKAIKREGIPLDTTAPLS